MEFQILIHLLTTVAGKSIVFVKTKDRLQRLEASLRRAGFKCASLQGSISMTERKAALRKFTEDDAKILIATDVASRGLDLPDVTHVYNFDLPANAAIYVHRAGRTARAGNQGVVISLVLGNEINFLERLERYTGVTIEKRNIKNICAEFPTKQTTEPKQSEKKRSRASIGGKGGFDKKQKDDEEKKPHHLINPIRIKSRCNNHISNGKLILTHPCMLLLVLIEVLFVFVLNNIHCYILH